jgi:prevent-host-death family protein
MTTTKRPITVTMRACRMDFAACLTAASEGHVVTITRRGKPVAQLIAPPKPVKRFYESVTQSPKSSVPFQREKP